MIDFVTGIRYSDFYRSNMKLRFAFLPFALLSLMFVPVYAQSAQPPIPAALANGNYVLDQLGWMTDIQKSTVNSIIDLLDRDGGSPHVGGGSSSHF